MKFYITEHITSKVYLNDADAAKVKSYADANDISYAVAIYELELTGEIDIWGSCDYKTVDNTWDLNDIDVVETDEENC